MASLDIERSSSLLRSGVSMNWANKMPLFWENFKWFFQEYQVWIMLIAAISIAGSVLGMILDLFNKKEKKEEDEVEYL